MGDGESERWWARDGGEVGVWFDSIPFDKLRAGSPGTSDRPLRQAQGGLFDRLTMNGGYEYVGSGWWGGRDGTGALGLLGAAGSPIRQAQGRLSGDAGMWFDSGLRRTPARLTMNGKGMGLGGREAGVERALAGVHSVGPMCSVFWPMCSVSGRMCSLWGPCVQFLAARVPSVQTAARRGDAALRLE